MTKFREKFGRNLRHLIKKRKLSQKEFSILVGVTESQVSKWLYGTHSMTLDRLPVIAKILRCTVIDLFIDC